MSNDRKNTPDLLGGTGLLDQFLSGEKPMQDPPTPPKKNVSALTEKLKDGETEKSHSSKSESPNSSKADKKRKVSFYFPRDITESIDLAVAQVRIYTGDTGYKASKSEFVEAALRYALDEFERFGKDSQITRMTEKMISRKTE